MEIFIVTTAIYDYSDCNLYSQSKAFSDREKARAFFRQECQQCLADAMGDEFLENEDQYPVDTISENDEMMTFARDSQEPIYYKVDMAPHNIDE